MIIYKCPRCLAWYHLDERPLDTCRFCFDLWVLNGDLAGQSVVLAPGVTVPFVVKR